MDDTFPRTHNHIFLGEGHEQNERRTWMVIALCSFMMVAEIIGGLLFDSIALVADGLHMSTHASALLLAALTYSYARRHANDSRFTFGTSKLGDLAGMGFQPHARHQRCLAGYDPRPDYGAAYARRDRDRWRPIDRPPPLASWARSFRLRPSTART
jgi:hypothetical protein